MKPINNEAIANELLTQARLLAQMHANLFRVRAYRHAAMSIMGLRVELTDILRERGKRGLAALPGIGIHLAGDIAEYIQTGVWLGHADRHARAS